MRNDTYGGVAGYTNKNMPVELAGLVDRQNKTDSILLYFKLIQSIRQIAIQKKAPFSPDTVILVQSSETKKKISTRFPTN